MSGIAVFANSERTRSLLRDASRYRGLDFIELDSSPGRLVAVAGPTTAVRVPGGLAAAALRLGGDLSLYGPTPAWFAGLDEAVTGRRWQIVSPVHAAALVRQGPLFVKLVDAKNPRFPARRYTTPTEFALALAELGSPAELQLLVTPGWLDIDSEYRCFTVGRAVVTCSPYLVQDEVWSPHLATHRASFHDRASGVLSTVLANLTARDVPPAAALDVARLTDGRFVVLEANQSWAAGLYGCDPDAVLASILASNDRSHHDVDRWRWIPDPVALPRSE
jgi:hypothetical protein